MKKKQSKRMERDGAVELPQREVREGLSEEAAVKQRPAPS